MQTGSKNSPEQEEVITRRREDILTWSLRYDIVFGHDRSTSTCVDTVRLRRTQVQTGSENCTQTGNTNNLATKPHIDAISVAILMFCGQLFTGVYANRSRRFLNPEIRRWRTYTGSSYKFATENDIKVISVAAAPKIGSTNKLTTETCRPYRRNLRRNTNIKHCLSS